VKVIIWQNMLSHLQSAHVRGLSDRGIDVMIVGLDELSPERRALGWSVPDFGRARTMASPTWEQALTLVRESGRGIHILAGWRGMRYGKRLLAELERRSARIGLLTEGCDGRGWRGLMRRSVYWKDALIHRTRLDFILAVGTQGAGWFRQCGYPAGKLFPYGYVTEQPPVSDVSSRDGDVVELIYLGQCVRRKGLDIALRALAGMRRLRWRLSVIGSGPAAQSWRQLAERLGIAARVSFASALPYNDAMARLAESDLLLLPSRYDGWGAVVNEALMLGVPAVCSDACGAKDLLWEGWRGEVFRSGSASALRTILEARIAGGRLNTEAMQRVQRWSRCLGGDSGAEYILSVIKHVYGGGPRPVAPWMAESVIEKMCTV
jgi:glycosyltransferase involved in cell wall biosynthesis